MTELIAIEPLRAVDRKPMDTGERLNARGLSLADLINSITSCIFMVDIDGSIITANRTAADELGREIGQLSGRMVIDFPEPPLGKALHQAIEQSVSRRKLKHYRDERSGHVFDVTVNPVIDGGGVIDCLVVNAADITDQERSLEAFREDQEHFRSLMESAAKFVVYRLAMNENSPQGEADVVFVSPSIEEMMDVSDPSDFMSWYKNNHPDDIPRLMEANLRALETGHFDEIMRIYHPRKDEWRWVHAISTGTLEKEGQPTYFNGIILDETDRVVAEQVLRKAEKELSARAKELEKINTALNVLLERRGEEKHKLEQGIMEDIRVLIRPFLMRLRRPNDGRERESLVDIINENLNRITSQFAQGLASGLAPLTPTEVRVAALIRDGRSSKEIAAILGTSVNTVSGHRRNIRAKLGLQSRKQNLRSYLQYQFHPER